MTYDEACEVAKKLAEPKTIGDMIKRSLAEKNDDPVFPSNILADKTVDQQFNEVFKEPSAADIDPALGGGIAGHMVMTKSGWKQYITDAYGIKRDPTTLLEIDSDGLVQISSIRDSVRSIS